jgi:hypothetical protein
MSGETCCLGKAPLRLRVPLSLPLLIVATSSRGPTRGWGTACNLETCHLWTLTRRELEHRWRAIGALTGGWKEANGSLIGDISIALRGNHWVGIVHSDFGSGFDRFPKHGVAREFMVGSRPSNRLSTKSRFARRRLQEQWIQTELLAHLVRGGRIVGTARPWSATDGMSRHSLQWSSEHGHHGYRHKRASSDRSLLSGYLGQAWEGRVSFCSNRRLSSVKGLFLAVGRVGPKCPNGVSLTITITSCFTFNSPSSHSGSRT